LGQRVHSWYRFAYKATISLRLTSRRKMHLRHKLYPIQELISSFKKCYLYTATQLIMVLHIISINCDVMSRSCLIGKNHCLLFVVDPNALLCLWLISKLCRCGQRVDSWYHLFYKATISLRLTSTWIIHVEIAFSAEAESNSRAYKHI
jgi:hypothetical protein